MDMSWWFKKKDNFKKKHIFLKNRMQFAMTQQSNDKNKEDKEIIIKNI